MKYVEYVQFINSSSHKMSISDLPARISYDYQVSEEVEEGEADAGTSLTQHFYDLNYILGIKTIEHGGISADI